MLNCDNPFWNFSLTVYAAPGVEDECLALQNALNTDVNTLLFCAWIGNAHKVRLTGDNLQAIDDSVRIWHDKVVRPLRAVRQIMKPMAAMTDDAVKELRKNIARSELRAEQIEQAMLFDLAKHFGDGVPAASTTDAIRHNVTSLLQRNMSAIDSAGAEPPKAERLIAEAAAYRAAARTAV